MVDLSSAPQAIASAAAPAPVIVRPTSAFAAPHRILQAAVPVLDADTVDTLSERILLQEHSIYSRAIQLIAEGRVRIEGRRVFVREEEEE